MTNYKAIATAALMGVAVACTVPCASAQPLDSTGCVNLSGFFMSAEDSDQAHDIAGFSLRLGFYVTETTELFGECSFGEALDVEDYLDYIMYTGLMGGLTQYVPLSDMASLYFRAKAGATIRTVEYDTPYDDDDWFDDDDDSDSETYFTWALGAGLSVSLTDNLSLEVGYDYIAIDAGDDFGDEHDDDWLAYHTIHAGLDIEF
jgi:opacity protein-like surface antigen